MALVSALRASFASIDITPDRPASLLGYFNDRVSTGVLDRLHCRLACLEDGTSRLLFVQIDTCLMESADVALLKKGIAGFTAEEVVVFASHTHTAPALADLYAVPKDTRYLAGLIAAIQQACASLDPPVPVTVAVGRGRAPGLASNRRWFLSGGGVATNPQRMHPSLLAPEGPVDDEVNTLFFRGGGGEVIAAFVSISNHTDTTGGSLVSADWPGVMEREVRSALGRDVIVFPLIGAAGNINHFDFLRALDQTSPEEARRLGRAYARACLASLPRAGEVEGTPLGSILRVIDLNGIEISDRDAAAARLVTSRPDPAAGGRDLTAEDIFTGDPAVERVFAGRLLELSHSGPRVYEVPLQLLRVGGTGFFAIPGEPFVEIGLAIKRLPGFSLAVPLGLANGYFGYIPLRECFDRGGYEVRPGSALLERGAAERILQALGEMAGELRAPRS